MDDYEIENISRKYLGMGIQDWGQTEAEREKATRKYVEAAGLKFGSKEADEWLSGVLSSLRRGEFWSEVAQLGTAIKASALIRRNEKDAIK